MSSRLVVIGGDAAGMTAASAVRKLVDDAEIVVLERGQDTSYSACGVPYWVAGDIESSDDLVARSPQEHRDRGIDVRLGCTATAVEPDRAIVTYCDDDGEHEIGYDRLLIATGASSFMPDLPGKDATGIHAVKDLVDGQRVLDHLGDDPTSAAIVGSGYIGIEMAEALVARGLQVTVVEQQSTPLPIVEDEIGELISSAMRERGVDLHVDAAVTGFVVDDDGRVAGIRTDDSEFGADLVISAFGVVPRSALLDVEKGPKDGIVTDDQQRVRSLEHVWAAGDCVVTRDRLTDSLIHLPLGTHANKQGLVAGESIAASLGAPWSDRVFPGAVQTAITKFCDLEIARTGLGRADAEDAGLDVVTATIETTTRAGYYPGAEPMTVWGIAERGTRRLLGVQIAGGAGAGLRVDAAATALWHGATVDDVAMSDLAYAPPFSSVWSPIQVLARSLAKALG